MGIKKNKRKTTKQEMAEEPGRVMDTAQSALERGARVYGQVEQAINDAYEKTSRAVRETYEKTKTYSSTNPGKTILITLVIGIGLGLLLGANTHRLKEMKDHHA